MPALPVIHTAHLFPELDAALVQLLKSLSREEWHALTIVPNWRVHHVAAHLLDTALRRLSLCRDGWDVANQRPQSTRELVDLVNTLNGRGVAVYGALSPGVLITLTEMVTPQLASYLASLDPMEPARFPVSWAGEDASKNWFDVARELTERWHHQEQIRLATARPSLMIPRLYAPVLDTFMRVLPHAYRHAEAPDGTCCDVVVPGECGGRWRVLRRDGAWTLVVPDSEIAAATTTMPAALAWRVFTKGASRDEATAGVTVRGDQRLGSVVLDALAIVG